MGPHSALAFLDWTRAHSHPRPAPMLFAPIAFAACGGNNYYCTGGVRKTVSSGYYSTGGDSTTRTGQTGMMCRRWHTKEATSVLDSSVPCTILSCLTLSLVAFVSCSNFTGRKRVRVSS